MCLLQVVLLSATMPTEVLDVTKKFMRDPIRILVKKEELTLEGIKQFYINVEREVGLLVRNTLVWNISASCFSLLWKSNVPSLQSTLLKLQEPSLTGLAHVAV